MKDPGAVAATAGSNAGQLVEFEIESLATGGDGVGRGSDGRVMFVPRTAPGDLVRARLRVARKRWARGELVELLVPGKGRREPPCPLYDRCGGCALQHLSIEAQRDSKRRIVSDALLRIGGLELDVPRLESAGSELGYRNRITMTLRRGADGVTAGFRAFDDPDEVVDIPDCLLAEEPVRRALGELREGWGRDACRLPGGDELRITIRASSDGEIALWVQGGNVTEPGDPGSIEQSVKGLESYVWTDAKGARRVAAGRERFADRWQGTKFGLGPGTFLQVNRAVSAAMDEFVDQCVGPRTGLRIADLYSGVGARALRWAREGAMVTAVDSDRDACAAARRAAREAGVDIRVVCAPVEATKDRYSGSDVVVVNPPRAGLAPGVIDRLLESGPVQGLAYVSCDPATLARDLFRLAPQWKPIVVRAFDAFPQTPHIETLVWLERTGAGSRAEPEER